MGLPICSICVSNGFRTSLVALVLALLLARGHGAAAPASADTPVKKRARLAALPDMVVRCTDGSVLKLKVLEPRLTLKTPYGTLVIPFANIREVQCATRISPSTARRVSAAIRDLGSDEPTKREDASAELETLQWKAYPALLVAEKSKDPEVRRRAVQLLEKIRKAVPEERLEIRKHDVVRTDDSKITGQLQAAAFRVNTDQFGEVRLKLNCILSVRSALDEPEEDSRGSALADPGHLFGYQMHAGKTFKFRVTGAVGGGVWGTNTYTLDSALAVAAVHAGAVKIGKTAVVTVKILPAQNGFLGSTRNGITSAPYGAFLGAYQFVKKR
jgi:hypothetical protein